MVYNTEWPGSSPYVTTVGATQRSNQYLPICGQQYYSSVGSPNDLPNSESLLFECSDTGEIVCSALTGGRITSGGGFSDYYDRETLAPWQVKAVNKYLSYGTEYSPPQDYFSVNGRAYPDIAAYGSNYFVYLGGTIIRESGTSASTPVVAAMVKNTF
jgi:hypothetical protein